MVPVVGATLIWLGAAVWLYHEGQTGWAVFMVLWGMFGISSVDNFIKPILISRTASLPLLLIVVGVFGGVLVFGFIGLFLGPTLLALGQVLIREWLAHATRNRASEHAGKQRPMIETDDLGSVPVERLISAESKSTQEEAIERALRPGAWPITSARRRFASNWRSSSRPPGSAATRSTMFSCSVRRGWGKRRWRTSSRRDGRQPALDFGPGTRTGRRPGGHPDQPRTPRRAVHRRDPPPVAGRRRDPLSGTGRLPDRHHDRRGSRRRARSNSICRRSRWSARPPVPAC
jgi:hypothetical protein